MIDQKERRDELKFKGRKRGGLPGKTYLQVMQLDFYLNAFLSSLLPEYLDYFVLSKIIYKYRNKDRLEQLRYFFMFSAVYDENRIIVLTKSNFVSRTILISLVNEIYKIVKKDKTKFKLYFNQNISLDLLKRCKKEINNIQKMFSSHYLSFSIGKLMVNRKGEENPNDLTTDAYMAILTTIDKYNYYRSKVPFHRLLELFLRNMKNKVIMQETWNLPENSILNIEKMTEEELHEKFETTKSEKLLEVDRIIETLSEKLKRILTVKYSLFNPLTIDEEKTLKLNRNKS